MTIVEAKNKFVQWNLKQVGTREAANNWNKYAENTSLRQLYGWYPQNQPWCDIYYDTGMIECFGLQAASKMTYQQIGSGSALCRASASFYKTNNAWFSTPEVGDQVFFYSSGDINHTGAVVEVKGSTFWTVEGNSSNMVAKRSYALGNSRIAGFGRPDWSVVASGAAQVETPKAEQKAEQTAPKAATIEVKPVNSAAKPKYHNFQYNVKVNLLKVGDSGPQVRNMQAALNAAGFGCGLADGQFGATTKNALVKFQKAAGLSADGEFGGQTFTALWNYQK